MKPYTLIGAGLLLFSAAVPALEKASPKQVEEVQQRTQQVVPYDLDQTKMTFTRTVHGGVQHVVVKSPDNTQQIKLIQENLLKMANDFRKGDFSVTEHIHGAIMPGLTQLKKRKPTRLNMNIKPCRTAPRFIIPLNIPSMSRRFMNGLTPK